MSIDLLKPIGEAAEETRKIIKDRKEGVVRSIATPWKKINAALLDGLEWGSFLVWGGVSGSGKTAIASEIMMDIQDINKEEDFIILFASFEMPASKVILRNVIAHTRMTREELLSAKGQTIEENQLEEVDAYLDRLKDKNIYFLEKAVTPEEYIKTCRALYKKYGKKLLCIADHSLLFEGENEDNDRGMLSRLSKQIITLKNEGWSIHILLSQLNRDIEKAERRMPRSPMNYPDPSCLFASSALMQASDYVFIIHRPYSLKFVGNTYGPDQLPTGVNDIYIHIIKQREGETPILKMRANFKEMRILDE